MQRVGQNDHLSRLKKKIKNKIYLIKSINKNRTTKQNKQTIHFRGLQGYYRTEAGLIKGYPNFLLGVGKVKGEYSLLLFTNHHRATLFFKWLNSTASKTVKQPDNNNAKENSISRVWYKNLPTNFHPLYHNNWLRTYVWQLNSDRDVLLHESNPKPQTPQCRIAYNIIFLSIILH